MDDLDFDGTRVWTLLDSSNVEAIRYLPAGRKLEVRFRPKRSSPRSEYQYHDVDEDVYEQMLTTGSPGRFVHYVLTPTYRYTKVY